MKCSGSSFRNRGGVKGLKRGAGAHANGGMSFLYEALKLITDKVPCLKVSSGKMQRLLRL